MTFTNQLFIDLDGVLADFDQHYADLFGIKACKELDNVDWDLVTKTKDFYLNMPMMPDAQELWDYVKQFNPIILTGVPRSVPEAPANKVAWVRKHLGPDVEVRTTRSSKKSLEAKPGDILVDDWTKYRKLWLKVGGVFITHTSAANSIEQLKPLLEVA